MAIVLPASMQMMQRGHPPVILASAQAEYACLPAKEESGSMTPTEFIAKWKNGGDERRDTQPFFEDLCRLIRHATPREADPEHEWFTYEYGAAKTSGGNGWADVWKRGCFGWEFKGTHKDLNAAYAQLKNYADALQNPPLLIVSDLERIIIHTNFTNAVKTKREFTIYDLENHETRQLLDAAFRHPDTLKPGTTRAVVTKEAADKFSTLAELLRGRGNDAHAVAHFLNRLLFCMFAEDISILPSQVFTKLVDKSRGNPDLFDKRARELFATMQKGGDFALENIDWFNGGLFDDDSVLRLTGDEVTLLHQACLLDWSEIEPSIFGTLFERGLNPDKRSQLGAHYTDPETIQKIVRPVIVEPWLREWDAEKAKLQGQLDKAKKTVSKAALDHFNRFLERLRAFTVLDPACGSGNFLYLSLRALKDIEKRILIEAETLGLPRQFPEIGPRNVMGLEINDYAAELARLTIWIGEIQWMIQNGYGIKKNPILHPLQQIECRDALLNADGSEAQWPRADAVVGNPPFLGDKKMLGELGDAYVGTLRKVYKGRVPGGADLVCYWFAKANDMLRVDSLQRAGLVATNSIRGGRNRVVLDAICDNGRIFAAWSDEDWVNEGAAVRVSLICFENAGTPLARHSREGGAFNSGAGHPVLDGAQVTEIHADLTATTETSSIDLTRAIRLQENEVASFIGTQKSGPFDIPGELAREWLALPNPNGRPNSDVVRPWANGMDVTRRPSDTWIVDYGTSMTESNAALYEKPFEHVVMNVKPMRLKVRRDGHRNNWWRHGETRAGFRLAVSNQHRFIATPRVSKHRLMVWQNAVTVPDCQIVAITRSDDTTFGILHSHLHELWSLRMGTSLEDRPRYTPTTCFETFPFPAGLTPNIPAKNYAADPRAQRIAEAARKLVEARDRWLNPPEWTQRVPEVVAGYPDRILAQPGFEAQLKKRTLTNLYNERPTWLDNLHRDLDTAVAAAYGWEWPLADDEILRRLFALNQERARVKV
jgi:type II restriction/modification system DNA methylase subunit YeeA